MLNSVIRSSVFSEFTPEEQEFWFSIKEKSVSHHIDSLYFSVFIENDEVSPESPFLVEFLDELLYMKEKVSANPDVVFKYHDLEFKRSGLAISGGLYAYHLEDFENYDIFISSYIPTANTPRIQVQLRTKTLVCDGLYNAVHKAYDKVEEILSHYYLHVSHVVETRIDYAFHTNCIQKPMEYFNDNFLAEHLDCTMRDAWKHSTITSRKRDFFELDYFALGSRKANNLYFRVYDKTKEVVQQNYKMFFFQIWRSRGLISRYDEYVLNTAYEMKSYKTGVSVGRINWYLEYGHDDKLKGELRQLLQSCNIKSDNNPYMEKKLSGVLPPITTIMNVEFETKRKFYVGLDWCLNDASRFVLEGERPELRRLYLLFELRRPILNELTTERVVFRADNSDPGSPLLDFWNRIRRAKIRDNPSETHMKLRWKYTRKLDAERTGRQLMTKLAHYSMLKNESTSDSTFGDDIWTLVSNLNDNDKVKPPSRESFTKLSREGYSNIRAKKARQIKSFIKEVDEFEQCEMDIPKVDYGILDKNDSHEG